ncbi:MAG TPA: glutamate synthase subunit alpha, partial [Kaistia sp.]|nr:glutamate synthase subunit alpha [Kaistia sp.]
MAAAATARAAKSTAARNKAGGVGAQGLYDPRNEHDACGVGFIANLKNEKSHRIVQSGLQIVRNLEHRGAVGADPLMGDGAGMLVQIPHRFFSEEATRLGFALSEPGSYAVGFLFLPQDAEVRAGMEKIVEEVVASEGQVLLGWRDVPVDNSSLSKAPDIAATEPHHRQVFIARGKDIESEDAFERRLFIIRKVISNRIYAAYSGLNNDFYVVSL